MSAELDYDYLVWHIVIRIWKHFELFQSIDSQCTHPKTYMLSVLEQGDIFQCQKYWGIQGQIQDFWEKVTRAGMSVYYLIKFPQNWIEKLSQQEPSQIHYWHLISQGHVQGGEQHGRLRVNWQT